MAQQKFIGGIADRLRDLCPIHPRDFSMTPALSLEDLRCKCQLFGGACRIVLVPDSLQLSFTDVSLDDLSVVLETVKRSEAWLSSALEEHERKWLSFHTIEHRQALDDGAIAAYLNQLVHDEVEKVVKSVQDIRLLPSIRVVLSGDDENGEKWRLQRVVEKSELIENGVFVDTWVRIFSPSLESFDEHLGLAERIHELADRTVGLQYEET